MRNFAQYVNSYQNKLEENDRLYKEFTEMTNQVSFLRGHRDYIEKNKLGFGDRAFHFMWYLILEDLKQKFSSIKMLEIGVYKGQVISLWSLLSAKLGISGKISAITPLEGNISRSKILNNRVVNKIRATFNSNYRKCLADGNNYLIENYEEIIKSLFNKFELPYSQVNILKGYSDNKQILAQVSKEKFSLIYIDGDHSYEGVLRDIKNFSGLLDNGGYLVMDDASWFLEGYTFWKGHKEVSRACIIIESLGFKNVLNVGHNRVYEKI